MTPGRRDRWLTWGRRAAVAGLACAALGGTGCHVFDKNSGSGGKIARGDDRPDPLLGSRIPATDLPLPGRDGYGKERKDPLLGSPVRQDKEERASRVGEREPFRPGASETAAALAGRLKPEQTGLSIGDRRVPGTPADGGPVPLRPADGGTAGGLSYADVTEGLKKFGATFSEPVREGNDYVFRADVPLEGGGDGPMRRYEGAGASPSAAAKQVLDQIKSDRGLE
jgi:hypothetical protein